MSIHVRPDLQQVSAFMMYQKTTKKNIKKKKQKQKSNEINFKLIKKLQSASTKKEPKLVGFGASLKQLPEIDDLVNSSKSKPFGNVNKTFRQNDNPTLDALHLFNWIIEPLSIETFFKTYWEQKVVHIKRFNKNYYTHILNSHALDKMLRNHTLYYTRNVDVVSYENGVKQVYNQEGRATPFALWDYYSNGCSIRILNPQTYNYKVHLLLATLQEYFGSMVGANVYLTPPGSQGFAPHYDDIEAFVIQLEGRKHWKLYQPKSANILARYSSPNLKHEEIGDPFMELTLNAGEVLYFPRGTIHEGCTDEESHSLHITVSVYQKTSYSDLLQHILPDALRKASESDVEFRRGLPLNYLKKFGICSSSKDRSSISTKVQDLVHELVKYVDIDQAADQLGKKFMHDSMPPVLCKDETERTSRADGPYLNQGKVNNRVEIDLDTRIRLLRYYCIRLVEERNSNPKLYYNTENATVYHGEEEQWLELEPSMIPLIRKLQSAYPCYIEVEKLPMEDLSVKMQLISDLWEHGLLVTSHPLEIINI